MLEYCIFLRFYTKGVIFFDNEIKAIIVAMGFFNLTKLHQHALLHPEETPIQVVVDALTEIDTDPSVPDHPCAMWIFIRLSESKYLSWKELRAGISTRGAINIDMCSMVDSTMESAIFKWYECAVQLADAQQTGKENNMSILSVRCEFELQRFNIARVDVVNRGH